MTKPMTEQEIEEARAQADAATPGPWEWWTSNSFRRLTAEGGRDGGVLCGDVQRDGQPDVICEEADRRFIAASRALVPHLLAEVTRLRAELGHVEPAEEPATPLRLLVDRPCECCGRTLRAGDLVAGFGGDEDDAPQSVMHWGPCPMSDRIITLKYEGWESRVEAQVYGLWGLHKRAEWVGGDHVSGWGVTHIPSGLKVPVDVLGRREAHRLTVALGERCSGGEFSEACEEIGRRVRAVVDEVLPGAVAEYKSRAGGTGRG